MLTDDSTLNKNTDFLTRAHLKGGLNSINFEVWCQVVGLSIKMKATDIARSASQGPHYHVDVIYVLPLLGIKKGARGFSYSELDPHPANSL